MIEIDQLFVLSEGDILLHIDLSWGLYRLSAVEILEYDFLLLQQRFILKSMPQLSQLMAFVGTHSSAAEKNHCLNQGAPNRTD